MIDTPHAGDARDAGQAGYKKGRADERDQVLEIIAFHRPRSVVTGLCRCGKMITVGGWHDHLVAMIRAAPIAPPQGS